jgi:hypothetical protein
MVLPGATVLRLWRDTIDLVGIYPQQLRPVLADKEKFLVDCWKGCSEPQELAAIVVLVRRPSVAPGVEPLHGAIAEKALRRFVLMRRPARALDREQDAFAALARLLDAGVTVWRISMPDNFACLGAAAAQVRRLLEQA